MGIEALVIGINNHLFHKYFNLKAPIKDADASVKICYIGGRKKSIFNYDNLWKIGWIQGTLIKGAYAVFNGLNKEKKLVAKRIFLELVQPEKQSVNSLKVTDTRRRVILEKLPNKEHSLELCLDIHLFKGNIAI